jgi:hypothetical protein
VGLECPQEERGEGKTVARTTHGTKVVDKGRQEREQHVIREEVVW